MKKRLYFWSGWLLSLIVMSAQGATQAPLAVDQAFPLSAWSPAKQTIVVRWDIQPGYYLYKDRIDITPTIDGVVQLGEPHFPPAVDHFNPVLGHFAAYGSETEINIPVLSAKASSFSLQVGYQGCAEQGYCYPPQIRIVPINLGEGGHIASENIDRIPAAATLPVAPESKPVQALLKHNYSWAIWLGFFGLGLLISLTPCVLPMIPVLFGLIIGKEQVSHWRAFLISLAYVLGMAITYAIAGILFGVIGSSLQVFLQKPIVIGLFSAIFILMALSLFGVYQLRLPGSLRGWVAGVSNRQRHGSLIGAAVMGALSTLILSPCATPPLVAVLSYIGQTGNAYLGGIALFIIGLGSGVPLIAIGTFGRRLLPKTGAWMRQVEYGLGIILLAVSIWMLNRILPDEIGLILWAALMVGIAIYLKTFSTAANRLQQVGKGLGVLVFVYGILLLVGALQGASEPWRPLAWAKAACGQTQKAHFIPVKTLAEVQQEMSQSPGKPVLLDFYADWCVSCKLLEQRVLANPQVQNHLLSFLWLRADITANDADAQALMHDYGIVAPPTIIVFSGDHTELAQSRIIGEISVADFLKRIKPAE